MENSQDSLSHLTEQISWSKEDQALSKQLRQENEFMSFEAFAKKALSASIDYGKTKQYYASESKSEKADWVFGFILVALFILAFTKAFYSRRISLLTKSLFNWKIGKQIIRYEKVYTHPVNIGLSLVFILSAPLFLASITQFYFTELLSLQALWMIYGVLLLAFVGFKFLSYQLSSFLLKEEDLFKEYLFHSFLILKLMGVVFLISIGLFHYSYLPKEVIVYTTACLSIFLLSIQLYRGLLISLQKTKKLHRIILYLCTLEILPMLLLGKAIIGELIRG